MIKVIKNFIQGTVFGLGGIVPAVSGGTMAIILGFYNELIEAINYFKKDRKKYIKFLLPLILGIITGLVLFSSVIQYLLNNFSFPTMTFFIGLIAGTIPSIYLKVKMPNCPLKLNEIMIIIIPIIFLLIISGLRPALNINPAEIINNIDVAYMLFLLFTGIITGVALVIPGVGGCYMMLLFGIYPLVTYVLSSVRFLFIGIENASLLQNITKVLIPLSFGMLIGGLSTFKLLGKLLINYYQKTYLIILGLLIGSIYILFKEPIMFQSGFSAFFIIIGIVTFSLGMLVSFFSGKNYKRKEIA